MALTQTIANGKDVVKVMKYCRLKSVRKRKTTNLKCKLPRPYFLFNLVKANQWARTSMVKVNKRQYQKLELGQS